MRPILLALILLVSTTLVAQQTRYRLERIAVEGSRVHEHIVRSEARLLEEREYTDEDFRQALYRIRRLPFVTDAIYRIEPGITAGASTLVIRILDTTPVFYDATLIGSGQKNSDHISRGVDAVAGGRYILDDLGVIEAHVQTFDVTDGASVGLTYRAYGLFDTSAFAIASIDQQFGAERRRSDPSRSLLLGWPLSQTQTLVLSAGRSKSRIVREDEDAVTLADRSDFSSVNLHWLYETHDDPLFATRGITAEAGPFWAGSVFAHDIFDEDKDEVVAEKRRGQTYGFNAAVTGYRALGARNVLSLSVGANAAESRTDQEVDLPVRTYEARVRGAVGHDFYSHDDTVPRPFRARLEAGVTYGKSMRRIEGIADQSSDGTGADVSLVLRHRWGTLRLLGSYDWR
jgi:hypothetical protein